MDAFIEKVDTAAMVIGYPVLAVVVILTAWFGTRIFRDVAKIFREMRFERRMIADDKRNRSNQQASWMLELDEVNLDPIYEDRYPTLELPDIPRQLSNYKEQTR